MLSYVVLNFLFTALLQYCNAQGYFQNVALHKRCSQSSYKYFRECDAAINGDTSGFYKLGIQCIDTGPPYIGSPYDRSIWWQVDLGQSYQIHHMVVWGRTDSGSLTRMSGCKITVDDDLCYTFPTVGRSDNPRFYINCSHPLSGQVISIYKNTTRTSWSDDYSISMCEFEVYAKFVCDDGYWGSDCDTACGRCSNGQSCDRQTGNCTAGCAVGFFPPKCTELVVNGNWGSWTHDACSVTCGGGSQTRTRSCDNPAPANGGAGCSGDSTETVPCNTQDCPPVNSQWGPWPPWGLCSKTCGGGTQSRSRQCDNPAPANGGADCSGSSTETQDCNAIQCQVEGSEPQTGAAVPVAAVAGAAVGGVVVTAAIAAVIFVFVRRRVRNTHDAWDTDVDRHAHGKPSSATSPEGGTTTDGNYYEDVSGLEPTRESYRRTNPDSAVSDTSSSATTAGAPVYQNVGDDAAANYESLDVSTVGQTSMYTVLKKPKK